MSEITFHSPFDDDTLKVDRVEWGPTMGSQAGVQIQITQGHGAEQKIITFSIEDGQTMAEMLRSLTTERGNLR